MGVLIKELVCSTHVFYRQPKDEGDLYPFKGLEVGCTELSREPVVEIIDLKSILQKLCVFMQFRQILCLGVKDFTS